MALPEIRLVLDTNTVFRGLAKSESSSGKLLAAVEARELLLLTSKQVVDEYRLVLLDPKIVERYPTMTPKTIELTLRSLAYLSDRVETARTRFVFPRDRKDEKFLVLAIAGKASHLITFDNDLLSLPQSHTDAAKRLRQRLPRLQIQMPGDFLDAFGNQIFEAR